MYKKIFLSLLIVSMLFVWLSKADVQDVSFRFCDDTENKAFGEWKKTFFVTPGEETELCMYFATSSEEPRKILYGFTTAEPREVGSVVCDADKSWNNDFSKYFVNKEAREFIIDKDNPKTIREKILLPIGMSGVQYWCLAYSLGSFEWTWIWWMFNLVVNKVFPISLFVGNGGTIENNVVLLKNGWGAYTTNKKIKATTNDENGLTLSFLIKNEGNINQNVEITGKIYNMLWFEKTFAAQANNVGAGREQEVIVDVGIIPFYKWFFTTKFNVQYKPNFEFDISNLDEEITKWWVLRDTAQIYIFSWITLIIIMVLLLVLIKIFMPRKKIIIKE